MRTCLFDRLKFALTGGVSRWTYIWSRRAGRPDCHFGAISNQNPAGTTHFTDPNPGERPVNEDSAVRPSRDRRLKCRRPPRLPRRLVPGLARRPAPERNDARPPPAGGVGHVRPYAQADRVRRSALAGPSASRARGRRAHEGGVAGW